MNVAQKIVYKQKTINNNQITPNSISTLPKNPSCPSDVRLNVLKDYIKLADKTGQSLNQYFSTHPTGQHHIHSKEKNGVKYAKANCAGINLSSLKNKDLAESNFSKAIFTGASFKGCTLTKVNFERTRIDEVDFSKARGLSISQLIAAKFRFNRNERNLKAADKKNKRRIQETYELKPTHEFMYFLEKCRENKVSFFQLSQLMNQTPLTEQDVKLKNKLSLFLQHPSITKTVESLLQDSLEGKNKPF